MIWFSSDFNFGHANIAGPNTSSWDKGFRDFESVERMNNTIARTVNKYVKPDDVLYYLGDFAFGGHQFIPEHRLRLLVETIHLVRGNHDGHIDRYARHFSSISDVAWCKDVKNNPIFMSHYAHRVWEGSHKGYIHLYGHSHDSIPDYGKSMDVGIDAAYRLTGEYRPFSINEIIEIMDKRDIYFPDHHGINTNVK